MTENLKTLIGVLASHDSAERNEALKEVFTKAHDDENIRQIMRHFRFVFTGGTYRRLFDGVPAHGHEPPIQHELDNATKRFLRSDCGLIVLPSKDKGGVILLSSLITQRKLSIVWPFFSPHTAHLLYPDNLALLRLADQWRVKKLLNTGSVEEWLHCEAARDKTFNLQGEQIEVDFPSGTRLTLRVARQDADRECIETTRDPDTPEKLSCDKPVLTDDELGRATIALISHDEMKQRMLDFVIDCEHELAKFRNILTTGTTGRLIQEASPRLRNRVKPYHSGPKGGDIEIATEVLLGGCHLVVFFVDPLHPHPHIEDIRVVFSSCMIQDKVPILTNEMQARSWMDRRIRGT